MPVQRVLLPPIFRVARAELMTQYRDYHRYFPHAHVIMNTFLEGDHFGYNEAGVVKFGRVSFAILGVP
jgi:hypothetical protein